MNYKLAKQLKDAGFKVEGHNCWERGCQSNNGACYPALSELLEACGDRFHAIEQKIFKDMEIEGGKWIAYSNESNDLGIEAHIFKQGSTPEEALSKLWLELNK